MGQASIKKPKRLAEKLLAIRIALNKSQTEMINLLDEELTQSQISAFERGTRTPSLLTLLKYSRLVGIHLEVLIDDNENFSTK